jgi:hypothetical protein
MTTERTPLGHIEHAAGLFRRGIICEGELWNQVIHRLEPGRVAAELRLLPEEATETLQRAFRDRPQSLCCDDAPDAALRREVAAWCETE